MVRHGEKWRDQDFMKVIILKLDLAKLLLSELNILVNVFVFLCSYDRTHFIVQEFFFFYHFVIGSNTSKLRIS